MTEQVYDVTGIPLRKIVQAAYDLSRPLGLGSLQYEAGSLTDEEADAIVDHQNFERGVAVLHLDYVKGRAVKLTVYRRMESDSRPNLPDRFISGPWHDHTSHQLETLLKKIGVTQE